MNDFRLRGVRVEPGDFIKYWRHREGRNKTVELARLAYWEENEFGVEVPHCFLWRGKLRGWSEEPHEVNAADMMYKVQSSFYAGYRATDPMILKSAPSVVVEPVAA